MVLQESSARGSISMLRHGRAISNVAGKLTHLVDKYSSGQMTEKDFIWPSKNYCG